MRPLPIDAVIPALCERLAVHGAAILTAAPGAGKSTRVPPALLDPRLLDPDHPRVVVLQPRRVAAVALAARIADERGWRLGDEVGHRIRFDTVGGERTRLWVQTEGTLTRQLQDDPYLEGVGAVVLDEFHERSVHVDLALAWVRELRRTVRPDLKLVVMSATIDPAPVAAFLDDAPVCAAPGTAYRVHTVQRKPAPRQPLAEQVAAVVDEALTHDDAGDILVFLPGKGEIEACRRRLHDHRELAVLPLHGGLRTEDQAAVLAPCVRRKVVLATNVAETSLTIDGVRTVIDSGQARVARFDPARGLDDLRLEPISRFSAEQRRGRAGRTADGRCYRLWSKLDDARRRQALDSELRRVDLAAILPALKRLHGGDSRSFPWFEAPEAARLDQAEALLCELGLTEAPYAPLTGRGRLLADLSVHPRQARLLLDAAQRDCPALGADVAALLAERDLRRRDAVGHAERDVADLVDRLECLDRARADAFDPRLRRHGIDPAAARHADRVARQLRRQAARAFGDGGGSGPPAVRAVLPRLLLAAYPDRVAIRSANDPNRLEMVGGIKLRVPPHSCLYVDRPTAATPLVVAHAVQGLSGRGTARVVLDMGATCDIDDLEAVHPGSIERSTQMRYVADRGTVEGAAVWRYRDLVLRYASGVAVDPAAAAACLAEALTPSWDELLAAQEPAHHYCQRWRWLAQVAPDAGLPPCDGALVAAVLADWCAGCRSRDEVLRRPVLPLLQGRLTWEQQRRLDDWAPDRWTVPSGSRIRLDYSGERPVLAVRIQELFGCAATPRLAGGRVTVLLHLLAPNYRPQQVTDDLTGFWQRTWPTVRKDLRGRYPKHAWPEDPLAATPECKGGRRGR